MSKPFLSKSKYLIGLQCHRLLWTHYNAKAQLPPVDERTQVVFDQGHEVGIFAQGLFPNGITVTRVRCTPNSLMSSSSIFFV